MACDKEKLDIKPSQSLVVPSTIEDLQKLMNNSGVLNSTPSFGELGADNYYMTTAVWNARSIIEQNGYIWAKDIYPPGAVVADWNVQYTAVYYTNVVLYGLSQLEEQANTEAYKKVKGCALFFRSLSFYNLAQLFCKPFDAATASTDPGIPLRLVSDVDVLIGRSTVQETYERIIADLKEAEALLPNNTTVKTEPSKAVVNALLARVYLSMRNYEKALLHSNASLALYSTLLDYNTLPTSGTTPVIPIYNAEVLLHTTLQGIGTFVSKTNCPVDTVLFNSYNNNDLRKNLFFVSSGSLKIFRGSYTQSNISVFAGITTAEVLLIQAEGYARSGQISEAMNSLNALMVKRWKAGAFIPFTANSQAEALDKILVERRKELIYRGLRWTDLRRLNLEGGNITLTRNVNATTYTLNPNSNLYVYPIPPMEMQYNPMPQNPR